MYSRSHASHFLTMAAILLILIASGYGCKQKADIEQEIKNLQATDKDVRQAAVKALVQIGPSAVDPLIRALKENNPDVQAAAARTLGLIGDKRAINPLIDMMKNSYDVELMFEVAVALSEIGDERACDALKTASKDANSFISRIAKKILAESGLCKKDKKIK